MKFLKMILPFVLDFLTDVINRCFLESNYPSSWKRAKVIAVPKKSGNSFRPISLLPILSKVAEKLAAKQITEHITSNRLSNCFQSGFSKYHSCKTAVLQVSDDIRRAMDRNRITVVTLLIC